MPRDKINRPRPRPRGSVVRRPLTPAEAARLKRSQEEVEAQKDEILAIAGKVKAAIEAGEAALDEAMRVLRTERERQGLSLADMQERTGIARSSLCTLENAEDPNPTIATVCRVAEALGMGVEIRLVPRIAAGAKANAKPKSRGGAKAKARPT